MEMMYLSEYKNKNRRAWVCRRAEKNDYCVIGYIDETERMFTPFAAEYLAEDYAEDWVMNNNQ
jgi:hypothetical protein